ncbi:uncharacterized protein LOC142225573 [Haematobia irritans]|uniref:uncharacterized protein LOC142225573 n=1 Tax=Haematobia irritans TaxID=7368 RepID=UPI003F509BEB
MVKAKRYNPENRKGKQKIVCRVCLKDHPLRFCEKFLAMDYMERMRIVSIYRHCAGCLAHDHTWRTCKSEGRCKKCGDMHHTMLHKPGPRSSGGKVRSVIKRLGPRSSKPKSEHGPSSSNSSSEKGPSSSNDSREKGPRSSCSSSSGKPMSSSSSMRNRQTAALVIKNDSGTEKSHRSQNASQDMVPYRSRYETKNRVRDQQIEEPSPMYTIKETVMLRPTAVVKIVRGDRYIYERAIIDPGADTTIIDESLVRRMGQKAIRVGNEYKCYLQLRGRYGMSNTVETYARVRQKYSILTPKKSVDIRIVDEYPGLQLADPLFYLAGNVHLSLGGDLYSKIIRNGVSGGTFGKPIAQFTIFGFIISGACSN